MTDLLGNLERLQKLRDNGTIDDTEFETQKSIILGLAPQPEIHPTFSPVVISEHDLKIDTAFKGKRRFVIYKWTALIIAFLYISMKYDLHEKFDDTTSKLFVAVILIFTGFLLDFMYKYIPIAAIIIVACIFSLLPFEIFNFILGPIGGYVGAVCGFISVCVHGYNGSQFFAKEEADDASMLHPMAQVAIATLVLSSSYYIFLEQFDGNRLPNQNAVNGARGDNQILRQPVNQQSADKTLVESVWDCGSVYGERIFVGLGRGAYTFAPRNPDGGMLAGRLIKKPKIISASGAGYDTYLTLEGSGSQPNQWSLYEGDNGPALFNYSPISGDGSECVKPGALPKYSTN